jgi:hypothetical protein
MLYWFYREMVVPEISRFFGIVIRMYFDDHAPPHFHACYAEVEALVGIEPIEVLHGNLPRRAVSMVIEWAALHQRELMANWRRLHSGEPPQKVAPLR